MAKTKVFLILILAFAFLLRSYQISLIPASLYWDESSLGYNAYSISETLRDEHGEFLPLTRFIAFGDYKAPGYIYTASPFIKIFGLNEFSVRLPSVLAGTLLVLVTFLLANELKLGKKMSLASAFVLAISPWAIQFSRGAFEANLATLFTALGVYFYLRQLNSKKFLFSVVISAIFFALSMYSFNTHRIFTPLLVTVLILGQFWKCRWKSLDKIIPFSLCLLLFILPLIPFMLSKEGRLRFQEVAWINDLEPIKITNERMIRDGNTSLGKVIHNRRIVYGLEFLKHYFDHFQGNYLFFSGDVNPRLGIQTIGLFYWVELALILFGLFQLVKYKSFASVLLISWIVLAPIPAAFARETPHALRTLNMIPAPQIIIAIGLVSLMRKWRYLIPLALVAYSLSIFLYLHDYFIHYPNKYALSWQYGYKQMINYVSNIESNYDNISVTEYYGRPYIYFLFYEKTKPEKFWQTANAKRDWFGFWYVYGFGKYHFGDWEGQGRTLFVKGPKGTPKDAKKLKNILAPDGSVIFEISEKR